MEHKEKKQKLLKLPLTACLFSLLTYEGSKAHNFHITRFRSTKGLKKKMEAEGTCPFARECVSIILIFYLLLGVPSKYGGCLCLLWELAHQGVAKSP